MVTLADIAQKTGVSTSTVSRILNGINKGVRTNATRQAQEVVRVARQMGYAFDQSRLAEDMDTGCRYVGILVEGFGWSAWEGEFIQGIYEVLGGSGYRPILLSGDQVRDFNRLQQLYLGLDCLICGYISPETRQELDRQNVKLVWMDCGERKAENCVYRDEYRAGEIAAQGMLDKGYLQLIMVGGINGPEKRGCFIERQAGVEAVAQRNGVPLISMQVSRDDSGRGDDEDFLRLLSKKIGAISLEIGTAMWTIGTAMERGLIAGRDYGLCSCGEMQIVTGSFRQLTRISFDRCEIGRQAAQMALRMVRGEDCPSRKIASQWIEGYTANSMQL